MSAQPLYGLGPHVGLVALFKNRQQLGHDEIARCMSADETDIIYLVAGIACAIEVMPS